MYVTNFYLTSIKDLMSRVEPTYTHSVMHHLTRKLSDELQVYFKLFVSENDR